jgi:hypothetical protein
LPFVPANQQARYHYSCYVWAFCCDVHHPLRCAKVDWCVVAELALGKA